MIRHFKHNDKEYTFAYYDELEDIDFPNVSEQIDDNEYYMYQQEMLFTPYNERASKQYINIGSGFDIETTKIPYTTLSTMYCWQFSLDELTIIGRTWDEFRELTKRISRVYNLHEDRRLLTYIHNQKFEFSFMKGQIEWHEKNIKKNGIIVGTKPDIFATDNTTVIKAMTSNFIEFRDSLVLTQMGLGKLAKNYELGIDKLKGDLDYSLVRHYKTKLENGELAYCINDVQILQRFYHKFIKPQFIDKGYNIPLTATGIVRDELKREYYSLPKKDREKYRQFIKDAYPQDENEYDLITQWVYRGGFNHANCMYTGKTLKGLDMGSFDFKSSYPAVMLHEKYPTKFKKVRPEYFYSILGNVRWCKDHAFWGIFKITFDHNGDVSSCKKTSHSIESKNKLIDYSEDAKFDNGRLIGATWVKVALTEQDVLSYLDFYSIKEWECQLLMVAKKEPLPKFFKDLILKYYNLKETLPKNTLEYTIAKAKLNSLYGMCVSALLYRENDFDMEDLQFVEHESENTYERAKGKQILLVQWGIWISAYARRNLLKTFAKLGDDAIYGDTDSAKIINVCNNQYIFDAYNDKIRRMNKTMYVGDYDRKIFSKIGIYDYEGKILAFKTLGCKRYLHTDIVYDKETNKYIAETGTTVAGMRKGSLEKHCEENDLDIFEEFDDGLTLSEGESDKTRIKYTNKAFEMELTDYLGNTTIVSERSCCTILDVGFSLKMQPEYLELVNNMERKRNRIYG